MFHSCVLSEKRIHLYRDIRQQDLEGQQRQLEEERCDWVYFEKIIGTKSDRPEFQKLLQEIQTRDTLAMNLLKDHS